MLAQLNPTSQRILTLMKGHTTRSEEAEILQLLGDADKPTLNQTLTELDLADLFNDVDDHWLGPKNKTQLLGMLSVDRLSDLEVPARASVVRGLQEGPTSVNDDQPAPQAGGIEEKAIKSVLLGTDGPRFTELKNAVNAGADEYDMHHLLHQDVDDQGFLADIYSHINTQAASHPTGQLKPMSDIDDTFYSSLKDTRYPGDTVYPGVLAFYDALDRGNSAHKQDRLGDLTFLSARPDEASGTVKAQTHRTLRDNGVKEAAVLLGSLGGLINHEAMARKKMENFEQYAAIYPEYSYSWTGDSGQGDAILGERLLERHPDKVKGVFIHNVTGLNDEQKAEFRQKGIRVFDTYVGAAVEAFDLGLITSEGLREVARSAQSDLAAIEFEDAAQKAAREADLTADLERVRERIG